MKIDLPIKIHNKFEIEVKDVTTGEIVQKGYAENIVLDSYFTSPYVHSPISSGGDYVFGYTISVGDGQGELDSARTTLFNRIASYTSSSVELVKNQVPLSSYATRKIVIEPSALIGKSITEVGVGYGTTVLTHALIRDSAGNSLTLGPKTGTQEITVYSTVYFVPQFDNGISLKSITSSDHRFINGFITDTKTDLRGSYNAGNGPLIYPSTSGTGIKTDGFKWSSQNPGVLTMSKRIETAQFNSKMKDLHVGSSSHLHFIIDFCVLAENNSPIWSGWEFDKTPIGIGDGSTTEFPLPWDEAWLNKPKTIYVDGVATAVTWTEDTITFATAPVDQAPITGSYWVKYIPKDSNHVLDITLVINYAEGVTT